MERISVRSSNIASIGYDLEKGILEVEFKKGSVYRYFGVPVEVYRGLMTASSHGRYLHANVERRYPHVKIA